MLKNGITTRFDKKTKKLKKMFDKYISTIYNSLCDKDTC